MQMKKGETTTTDALPWAAPSTKQTERTEHWSVGGEHTSPQRMQRSQNNHGDRSSRPQRERPFSAWACNAIVDIWCTSETIAELGVHKDIVNGRVYTTVRRGGIHAASARALNFFDQSCNMVLQGRWRAARSGRRL